jgi:hypothetical protein
MNTQKEKQTNVMICGAREEFWGFLVTFVKFLGMRIFFVVTVQLGNENEDKINFLKKIYLKIFLVLLNNLKILQIMFL